jgi:hypothetical protein
MSALQSLSVKVEQSVSGWTGAWASLRDNPLLHYWTVLDARRAGQPLQRLLPLLFGALALGGMLWLMRRALWDLDDLRDFPLLGLAVFGLAAGGVWLLQRLVTAGQLALAYLSRDEKLRLQRRLDELVLISGMSEQESLLGGAWAVLRQLLPPIYVLSAALVLLLGVLVAAADSDSLHIFQGGKASSPLIYPANSLLLQYMLAAPLLWLKVALQGTLAAALLAFYLISLSVSGRAGLLPATGALLQVPLQAALSLLALVLPANVPTNPELDQSVAVNYVVLLPFVLFLLLYLARRVEWLRLLLATGIGTLLLLLVVFQQVLDGNLLGGASGYAYYDQGVMGALFGGNALWTLTAFTLVNPQGLDLPRWLLSESTAWELQTWRYPLLLLLQFVLLLLCAELARDALRRRKWGSLSDVYGRERST